MAFSNPILGGGGELVRDNIHSSNYVAGVSGWKINRDGDAEFNDVTVRGELDVQGSDGSRIRARTSAGHADVELTPETVVGQTWDPGGLTADVDPTGGGVDNPSLSLRSPAAQGSASSAAELFLQGPGQTDQNSLTVRAQQIVIENPDDPLGGATTQIEGTVFLDRGPINIDDNGTAYEVWGKRYVEKPNFNTKFDNTFSNDPDLRWALEPDATYVFWMYLIISSASASADFKMQFTVPAGADLLWVPNGLDPTVAVGTVQGIIRRPHNDATANRALAAVGTGFNSTIALPQGRVTTGGTAGSLILQWAQNVTDAVNATQVLAGSHGVIERVA